MSSIFPPRRNPNPNPAGAGGKIVRNRRPPPWERTPYARPKVPREEEEASPGNPNWFSGLIRPAKVIVSGAGKIVSAVFGPDSPPSEEEEEEDSIGDSGDIDQTEDDLYFEENAQENKELSPRSTNKCLIEQLVSQGSFSREESEELIKLIQSRIVDDMTGKISATAGTSHDVRSTAIIEARKWLQEKKLGSDSKSRSEHRIRLSSLGALAQATEPELGSPIDVAKSYMQARPPWASPSLKPVEFRTPSPSLIRQSFDEPPISILGSSLRSPESAIATGAWNIMEEIRKVRSKATEELLASKSSEKINTPLLASKRKTSQGSLAYNGNEMTVVDGLYNWTAGIPDIETKAFVDLEALDHHGSSEINAHDENGPGESEANPITKTVAENGLLVSTSSLSAAIDGNKTLDLGGTKDSGIENGESKHENLTSSPVLENLTRDLATVNEETSMGSGSEGSTGMLPLEPSQDSNQQDAKQRLAAKNNSTSVRGRRARAYTRRVKGEK